MSCCILVGLFLSRLYYITDKNCNKWFKHNEDDTCVLLYSDTVSKLSNKKLSEQILKSFLRFHEHEKHLYFGKIL